MGWKLVRKILKIPYFLATRPREFASLLYWSVHTLANREQVKQLVRVVYSPSPAQLASWLYLAVKSYEYSKVGRRLLETGEWRIQFEYEGLLCDFLLAPYLEANPDVVQAVTERKFVSGLDHFLKIGLNEILDGRRRPFLPGVEPKILSEINFDTPRMGRYLCYFAHYDPQSVLDDHVIHSLEALNRCGCDIVFCTGTLSESEWPKLESLCIKLCVRNKLGFDFTSWFCGLQANVEAAEGYERVILANDSVYFPLCDPSAFFAEMDASKEDMWGITASVQSEPEERYHVQSYFMAFSQNAIKRGILTQFQEKFRRFGPLSRCGFIDEFEYGLTEMAQALDLGVGAQFSTEDLRKCRQGRNLPVEPANRTNPTIHHWDDLLESGRCPVLKVSLIRDDPVKSFDWTRAKDLIADNYPIDLIVNHQARIRPGTLRFK